MAIEVLNVADDFGMTPAINRAVLHAHRAGALHAAALMTAQPATAEAVALARETPSLQVGWHLHLNDSIPATVAAWPWGASPARAGWSIGLLRSARELARREIARQWELFRETGLPCRFVNCHHHLHAHPFVYRTLREVLGAAFPGWVRLGALRPIGPRTGPGFRAAFAAANFFQDRRRAAAPWPSPATLYGVDRVFQMDAEEVRAARAALPDGRHEFLFHPRSPDCPDTLCLLALSSSPSA